MNFASTNTVRARKAHSCEECGRIIEPGETYHPTAGSWEGDFFTIKACAHCNIFRKHINAADDYYFEGYYGGASEWVANGYHSAGDLPGLTFPQRLGLFRMARQFGRRWRDRTGQLVPIPDDLPEAPAANPVTLEAVPTGAASLIPTTGQDTK